MVGACAIGLGLGLASQFTASVKVADPADALAEPAEYVIGFGSKKWLRERFVGLVELCRYEHEMRSRAEAEAAGVTPLKSTNSHTKQALFWARTSALRLSIAQSSSEPEAEELTAEQLATHDFDEMIEIDDVSVVDGDKSIAKMQGRLTVNPQRCASGGRHSQRYTRPWLLAATEIWTFVPSQAAFCRHARSGSWLRSPPV
eukprot:SAG31_NODE_5153_length_2712_cov_2.029851_4_plen_201_part_00